MNKARIRERLRGALQQTGGAWIFPFWAEDANANLDRLAADLEDFAQQYKQRFGERPDPFALLEENPLKGAAFFQIDTLLLSADMKIMVWRILLGCEIARVEFRYHAGAEPALLVVLQPPYGQRQERYEGQKAADFRVLRHFGTTGVNGKLFLQGYYAARGTV
jgi:hypothetical protein